MPIVVAPIAGILDLAAGRPDAGAGGDAFAPLIAQLLTPTDALTDGKTVPPSGEVLPGPATDLPALPEQRAPTKPMGDGGNTPDILLPGMVKPQPSTPRAAVDIARIPAPARFRLAAAADPIILTPPVSVDGDRDRPAAPVKTIEAMIVPEKAAAPAVDTASDAPPTTAASPTSQGAADLAARRASRGIDQKIATATSRPPSPERVAADPLSPETVAPDEDDEPAAVRPLPADLPIRPDILLPGAMIVPVQSEPSIVEADSGPPSGMADARPSPRHPGLEPEARFSPSNPPAARSLEGPRPDLAGMTQDSGIPARDPDTISPQHATPPQSPAAAAPVEPATIQLATSPVRARGGFDIQPPLVSPRSGSPAEGPKPADPRTDAASVARPDAVPAPTALQPAVPAILPALQAFSAAMRRAWSDEREPVVPSTGPTAVIGVAAPAAVTIPAESLSSTLDTADRRWPHAMAQQIERLRDQADETSTRIRLLPDALGPVDVAVRRDGDTVHVHFAAREAETRQLLADAQPRLVEAADARGLKLGRADISGGDANLANRQQQRAPAQLQTPSRPAPARVRATAAESTDTRIA